MGNDDLPPSVPWYADPRMGFVIGMTFLGFCFIGPFALVIPLIGWLAFRQRGRPRGVVELPPERDEL
jgi:hypothetical protein